MTILHAESTVRERTIINVTVRNSVARLAPAQPRLVCDNDKYRIRFSFDEEWDGYTDKVARFISKSGYTDVEFSGDEVDVPRQVNTLRLLVGVYTEGGPFTTTSAVIPCDPSVLSENSKPSVENDGHYLNEARELVKEAREAAEDARKAAADVQASVIVDVDALPTENISPDTFYRLKVPNGASALYHYVAGEWYELADKADLAEADKAINAELLKKTEILDVDVLPTEDVKDTCLYRIRTFNGIFFWTYDDKLEPDGRFVLHFVDVLPTVGVSGCLYYQKSDGEYYIYAHGAWHNNLYPVVYSRAEVDAVDFHGAYLVENMDVKLYAPDTSNPYQIKWVALTNEADALITVDTLPESGGKDGYIYRIQKAYGVLMSYDDEYAEHAVPATLHYVDSLPDVGVSFDGDHIPLNIYKQKGDNGYYSYQYGEWQEIHRLFGIAQSYEELKASNFYIGFIPQSTECELYVADKSDPFNVRWVHLNKKAVSNVTTLPMDDIDEEGFYKTSENFASIYIKHEDGSTEVDSFFGVPVTLHAVDELPTQGELAVDNAESPTRFIGYYCRADKMAYVYYDSGEGGYLWIPLQEFLVSINPNATWKEIQSVDEVTDIDVLYIRLNKNAIFHYDGEWHELVDKAELEGALGEASNALKATASGAKVTIEDISPITHTPRVRLRSRNVLPYPYANATMTKNGITFTANADGSVTVNGTATANVDFGLYNGACYLTAGTYGVLGVGATSNVRFLGEFYNGSSWITGFYTTGTGKSFALTEANVANTTRLYICVSVTSGETVNNLTLYPIIAKDNIPTKYTPYTTDFSGLTLKRYGATESELLATYKAKADGTVDGVTSLYPITTLEADDAATVEVEYNRDMQAALDGKLDKVTSTSTFDRAYIVTGEGTQSATMISSKYVTANSLVKRTSTGAIVTAPPTADNQATPKVYVDSKLGKTTEVLWSEVDGGEYIVTDGEYVFGFDATPSNGCVRYNGSFDSVFWRGQDAYITVSGDEKGWFENGVILSFNDLLLDNQAIIKFRELPCLHGPQMLLIEVIL